MTDREHRIDTGSPEERVKAQHPDAHEFYHHFGLCEIQSGDKVLGAWWGGPGCMRLAWTDAVLRLETK